MCFKIEQAGRCGKIHLTACLLSVYVLHLFEIKKVLVYTFRFADYSMSLNFGYKGFDLALDFNGVTGNSIVNTKKLPTYAQFNYYMYTYENRWHGEGNGRSSHQVC